MSLKNNLLQSFAESGRMAANSRKLPLPLLLFLPLLFITFVAAPPLRAGETGKIAGQVTDKETGEPLAGANVMISAVWVGDREIEIERAMGAATDANGNYFIIGIPPGQYTVRALFIGYKEERLTRVRVNIDKTTLLDFRLETKVLTGEEIVVSAYKPNKVEVDLTATKQTYNIQEVQSIAGMADISDILELQADVVDDHFRGGRVGESLYLLGGGALINPLNNQRAFDPIVIGLQQVEVYTSGFSAEYGNAQSGVVNMVTREGQDRWSSHVEFSLTAPYYKTFGGSIYSPENLYFFNRLNDAEEWLKENPTQPGKPLWDLGYNAPVYLPPRIVWPPNPLTHADSLKMAELGRIAWLQSVRDVGLEYGNSMDYRLDYASGGPIAKNTNLFVAARQNLVHPIIPTPQNDIQRQIMSNLTYRMGANDKLKVSFTYDYRFTNIIGSQFLRWTFDRTLSVTKSISTSQQYGLEWKHLFSPSTFLNWKVLVLNILQQDRIELLDENQFLEDYSSGRNWVDYTGPSNHRVGRVDDDRGDEDTRSYEVSAALTSQLNQNNLMKAGLQFFYYDVDVAREIDVTNSGSFRAVDFAANPYEGALYLQDKMEFEGLIANIGLRFDFYNLNTEYYADEFSPLRNPNYDPTKPYIERGLYYDPDLALKKKTGLYTRLQPRIGISFPVSENSVFHLNYGTFTQRPNFNQVFFSQMTMFNEIEVLGNPRLRPENTKAYDVGLVQGLPLGFYLDVSAYYKDVSDLVESAFYFDEQQSVYRTYRNRDYANIRGFHVNLEKRIGLWRGYLRYNYESATGKSSNDLDAPVTFFEKPAEGQEPVELPDPEDIFLDYDRTHKAVFNLRIVTGPADGLQIGSLRPFADISLSGTLRFMTGRPYTWDETGQGLRFNQRTPKEYDLRFRLEKKLRMGNSVMTAYLEGFNLLNRKVYHYSRTFSDERNVVIWEKDRDNIQIYSQYAPYTTSQALYIFSNQPRHYRFGLIFDF